MKIKIFSLLIFLLWITSCTKLEKTNPFDPNCPKELWTPTNFNATLEGTTVMLTWSQPVALITGFKISRKVGSAAESPLPSQTKDNNQLSDNALTGGQVHVYTLYAYAENNQSNSVTVQVTPVLLATLTTSNPSSVLSNSVNVEGAVSTDGGSPITERGICWGTTTSPTTSTTKLANGTGTGTFGCTISGLSPGTLYYFRAYAINSKGTAYGNEVTAATTAVLPVLTTTASSAITTSTATSGGNITSDGGAAVTARGVCWGPTTNPTITNSKTNDGTGTGIFTSSATGLTSGTKYYLRAYATNSAGTAYGNEVTFTTFNSILVTTANVSAISTTTATSGGNLTNDGGSTITERGICYSTSQNPTTANSKIINGSGLGSFSCNLNGLTPGTTYYVRAYATNIIGSAYGSQVSFTTIADLPVINTSVPSSVTFTTATSGGTISSDGGATVNSRGVCWSTVQNPTISNSKTSDGTGTGVFISSVSGLTQGTTYYFRAYATNSIGTAYGNQVSCTTSADLPVITTSVISSITSSTAVSGGNITSDGGAAITTRGVCWGTSQNPSTANNKTSDGQGAGAFASTLTGLTEKTTYYVRAYATNSTGTSYGTGISFTTPNLTVTDVDGNIYSTVTIGTQVWMVENLKTTKYADGNSIPNVMSGWSNLSSAAYCWYNNDPITSKNPYGALYNWYTVNTGKLCPAGWHVPSDPEWTTLDNFVGSDGLKLKETGFSHWLYPGYGDYANNSTGFTALPGGSCSWTSSSFDSRGYNGYWWSSSNYSTSNALNRVLGYYSSNFLSSYDASKKGGYSVRCLKD